MAASYRYKVIAGDSLKLRVRYTAANEVLVGFPSFGATWRFTWGNTTHEVSTQGGSLTLDEDGWITGVVAPSVTQNWPGGHEVTYRLRLTDPQGIVETILQGDVEVEA